MADKGFEIFGLIEDCRVIMNYRNELFYLRDSNDRVLAQHVGVSGMSKKFRILANFSSPQQSNFIVRYKW